MEEATAHAFRNNVWSNLLVGVLTAIHTTLWKRALGEGRIGICEQVVEAQSILTVQAHPVPQLCTIVTALPPSSSDHDARFERNTCDRSMRKGFDVHQRFFLISSCPPPSWNLYLQGVLLVILASSLGIIARNHIAMPTLCIF